MSAKISTLPEMTVVADDDYVEIIDQSGTPDSDTRNMRILKRTLVTEHVLLIPTVNKTIPANCSLVVGSYYELGSGIEMVIEEGANLQVH